MVTRDMKCEIVLPASNTVLSLNLLFYQLGCDVEQMV